MDNGCPVTGYEMEMAGMTDRGLVRPSNQDSFVVLQKPALPSRYLAVAAVFDGVGGQVHGARASSAAVEHLIQLVGDSPPMLASSRALEVELEKLMRKLHKRLKLDELREPALQGMATTATVALLGKDFPATLWIGHVGDSPAFRLRGGQLQKLTKDDSVVCDLVREGLVAPEDAARHPQRHIITQALGSPREISPHVAAHSMEPDDCYLLCTDGLTNMVSEDAIRSILTAHPPSAACKQMIEATNSAGGIDNVTVVVMKFARKVGQHE